MGKSGAQRGVRSKIENFSKFFEIFFWSQNDIKSSKSDKKWKINKFPVLYGRQRFFAGGSGGPARPPSIRQRGIRSVEVKNFQKFSKFFLVSK